MKRAWYDLRPPSQERPDGYWALRWWVVRILYARTRERRFRAAVAYRLWALRGVYEGPASSVRMAVAPLRKALETAIGTHFISVPDEVERWDDEDVARFDEARLRCALCDQPRMGEEQCPYCGDEGWEVECWHCRCLDRGTATCCGCAMAQDDLLWGHLAQRSSSFPDDLIED